MKPSSTEEGSDEINSPNYLVFAGAGVPPGG